MEDIQINDISSLQAIINDLTRRLKNANHTIFSQDRLLQSLSNQTTTYRNKLSTLTNMYHLEINKNNCLLRKQNYILEKKTYESNKEQLVKMEESLQLLILDQKISKSKIELVKINKFKLKIEQMKKDIERQYQMINYHSDYDNAIELLCKSCESGDILQVLRLMQAGTNINDMDAAGLLPIHYACRYGHMHLIKLLLEYGSDCSSYITGVSPLEFAVKGNNFHCFQILIDFGTNIDDIGSLTKIKTTAKSIGGVPPLLIAAKLGFEESINELLRLGANVNIQDENGNTCLHYAAENIVNPVEIIEILLRHNADVKIKNYLGKTAADIAFSISNGKAIQALKSMSI